MKNCIKKLTSFVLAGILVMGISVTALAAETDEPIPAPGIPIGTHAEEDGILLEDGMAARAGGLPFTMIAIDVSRLLTTYSSYGKYFTGGDLNPNDSVVITGNVSHSKGLQLRVGACYYYSNTDTFYTVKTITCNSGANGELGRIKKIESGVQYFYNSQKYYGHITNYSGTGSVSGEMTFSLERG